MTEHPHDDRIDGPTIDTSNHDGANVTDQTAQPDDPTSDGPTEDVEVDLGSESYTTSDDDVAVDLGENRATGSDPDDADIDLNFGSSDDESDDEGINLDFATAQDEEDDEDDEDEDDPADDVADKALAELREELHGKFGDWYVVHTYSGMENRVAQNLENRVSSLNMEDFIFEVRVPTEEVTELRNGVKKNIKRTVLPGYVLVRMDLTDQSWSTVRHTPSVTGFVGHANQPIPLSVDEVENMLAPAVIAAAQAASSTPSRARKKKQIEVADFTEGDSVMVVEGPFAGVHATITEINASSQRLKALVEILGRETPVDLTFAQIQKV